MKITYCVYGLIEWHLSVPAGMMLIPVEFSGGKISGFGVSPATYTTSDPVVQRALESTSWFRNGKMKILRRVENSSVKASVADSVGKKPSPKRVVDVPDLGSARQQIIRLTGMSPSSLRSRADIEAAALSHNINLIIAKQ